MGCEALTGLVSATTYRGALPGALGPPGVRVGRHVCRIVHPPVRRHVDTRPVDERVVVPPRHPLICLVQQAPVAKPQVRFASVELLA